MWDALSEASREALRMSLIVKALSAPYRHPSRSAYANEVHLSSCAMLSIGHQRPGRYMSLLDKQA